MPFAAAEGETKKIKKKRMNERFAEWDAFSGPQKLNSCSHLRLSLPG